ncbi:MAG: rRNA pseudouridine synthase [candidate division KSB1 bacterium]|nr:rRNA pseudouridine synthase [candidate division KSB1 bacterium]MDZ7301007.1 rRNA pseudouridine synthase [candidate division KSB1 bacterium]MDZ7310314.1 rRNA pseudouridine synthase [candidate division KSB1 bacterium]
MKAAPNGFFETLQALDTMRLNRYLALCGLGSRREAEKLIIGGQVKINGEVVRNLATQVKLNRDEVAVGGEIVRPVMLPIYIMLNKPAGYLTTAKDEAGRQTIFELVNTPVRVFPVGRLDRDSEGLLLLTNDGELANRLMHPRFKVPKVYRVWLNQSLRPADARQFREGVVIDHTHRVRGELGFPVQGENRLCEVTIFEGRNRQVRKMFAALGYRVKALQRTRIGPLPLGKLKPGVWRYLTGREIKQLKNAVELQSETNHA